MRSFENDKPENHRVIIKKKKKKKKKFKYINQIALKI